MECILSLSAKLRPYIPMFLVFISGLGFSLQTLVVKLLVLNNFEGAFNCILSRGLNQFIVCGYLVYIDEDRMKGNGPKLFGDTKYVQWMMLVRSLAGYSSVAFGLLSAEYLSVGDCSTLVMLSPIFSSVLSYFVIGEPWRIPEFIGSVLAIIGAVMVAKPSFVFGGIPPSPIGVIFALISAISAAVAYLCIRILGTTAKMPYANICVAQALAQILISIPVASLLGRSISLNVGMYNAFLIFIGGFIGCFSQIFMTIGMQREKSALATAMRMSDVAFGYMWQLLFTRDALSLISLCGATLVTSSILFMVATKQVNSTGAQQATIQVKSDTQNDEIEEIELYGHIQSTKNISEDIISAKSSDSKNINEFYNAWIARMRSLFSGSTDYRNLSQESQHGTNS